MQRFERVVIVYANQVVMRTRTAKNAQRRSTQLSAHALRCRRKFLRFFPDGYRDEVYVETERNYKLEAHKRWNAELDRATYRTLLDGGAYDEIASRVVKIESRTNLLFSFEKMAIRDAVRMPGGAKLFAEGLYDFVYPSNDAKTDDQATFERWCNVVAALPRKQTRVLTWPIVTVFGFIARPDKHLFLKPNVTREAARAYGFDFVYRSRPSWETYASLLEFGSVVRHDTRDLKPRDMIDIQGFIWVQGSDEYG